MKPSAIFGLVVRSFGVFLLYQAIHLFAGVVAAAPLNPSLARHFSNGGFITAGILALASVWFLFGAPPIHGWAYPQTNPDAVPRPDPSFTGPQRACVSCEKPIPVGTALCPVCGWRQP